MASPWELGPPDDAHRSAYADAVPRPYWLDRPEGTIRDGAVALATRIAKEAGLSVRALAGFLKADKA